MASDDGSEGSHSGTEVVFDEKEGLKAEHASSASMSTTADSRHCTITTTATTTPTATAIGSPSLAAGGSGGSSPAASEGGSHTHTSSERRSPQTESQAQSIATTVDSRPRRDRGPTTTDSTTTSETTTTTTTTPKAAGKQPATDSCDSLSPTTGNNSNAERNTTQPLVDAVRPTSAFTTPPRSDSSGSRASTTATFGDDPSLSAPAAFGDRSLRTPQNQSWGPHGDGSDNAPDSTHSTPYRPPPLSTPTAGGGQGGSGVSSFPYADTQSGTRSGLGTDEGRGAFGTDSARGETSGWSESVNESVNVSMDDESPNAAATTFTSTSSGSWSNANHVVDTLGELYASFKREVTSASELSSSMHVEWHNLLTQIESLLDAAIEAREGFEELAAAQQRAVFTLTNTV